MVADLNVGAAPATTGVPPGLATLADYERRAVDDLPPAIGAHIEEAAGSGQGARDNRAAFDRWRLVPRALADLSDGHTRIDLFGRTHQAPILFAPIAYGRLAHPDGEIAVAQAATAIGMGMVLSTLSSVSIEDVAMARRQAAASLATPPAPLWFQLYLQPRRDDSLALVRRAEEAGYEAIVLTIDAGVKRAGFDLPPGVAAVNLGAAPPQRQVAAAGGRILFGTPLVDAMPRWADLEWLRAATTLPLVVKGMVVGDDLTRLIDAGVDALVASNHGGRILDALPSAIDLLPAIRDVVGDRLPVLVDGGVRSGADIVKALCLGARTVLVGRPVMHGLAVAGMAGVAHVAHILRTEVEAAMAQLGCPTPDHLGTDRLFRVDGTPAAQPAVDNASDSR